MRESHHHAKHRFGTQQDHDTILKPIANEPNPYASSGSWMRSIGYWRALVPAAAIALACARLGCVAAGCCSVRGPWPWGGAALSARRQ